MEEGKKKDIASATLGLTIVGSKASVPFVYIYINARLGETRLTESNLMKPLLSAPRAGSS